MSLCKTNTLPPSMSMQMQKGVCNRSMHALNRGVFIVTACLGIKMHLHSTCGFDMILPAIMKSERHVELACRLTQFHELQHRCLILIAQLPNGFGQEHVIRVVAPWHIAQALRGVADDGLGLRLAAAPVSCAERIPVHCCITCACSQLSWGTLHSG